MLDVQIIEESVHLPDARQSVARQHCDGTKVDPMVDQFTYIGTHRLGAGLSFRVDSLIAVNVERDADILEKPAFQKLDVTVSQDGQIGLDGISVFKFASKDLLLNQIYLLVKLKWDQEGLAAMPDEICALDRRLVDAVFDVPKGRAYLIQTHTGHVAKVRKFIAIIASEIAIFGNFDDELWRRTDGHRQALRYDLNTSDCATKRNRSQLLVFLLSVARTITGSRRPVREAFKKIRPL